MRELSTKISRQYVELANAESVPYELDDGKEVILVFLDLKNFKKFVKQAHQNRWNSYAISTVSYLPHAQFRPDAQWYFTDKYYMSRDYYAYDLYNFLNTLAKSEIEKKAVAKIKQLANTYYEHKVQQYDELLREKKYAAIELQFLESVELLLKGDMEESIRYMIEGAKIRARKSNEDLSISVKYKAYREAFSKIASSFHKTANIINNLLKKYNIVWGCPSSRIFYWDGYPAVLEKENFIEVVKQLHKSYTNALDDPDKVLRFHKLIHKYLIFFEAEFRTPYVPNGVFDPFLSDDVAQRAAMVEPVFEDGKLHVYVIETKDFLALDF